MDRKFQQCHKSVNNLIEKYSMLNESDYSELAVKLEFDSGLTEAFSGQESNLLRSEDDYLKKCLKDIQELTSAQKELYTLKKEDRANRQVTELKELYAYCDARSQLAKDVSERLKYVVKNKEAVKKILREPVDPSSLPMPLHLHKNTVALFEGMAQICNRVDQSVEAMNKLSELDVMKAFSALEEECRRVGTIASVTGEQLVDIEVMRESHSRSLQTGDSGIGSKMEED